MRIPMRTLMMRRKRKMIRLKVVRKMSGRKIKQDKRNKELHPTTTIKGVDWEGNPYTFEAPKNVRYENKGLYRKNRVQKRHVENPNIYKGEEPIQTAVRNIRIPRKCRKTAWKRFQKAFPYVKVDKKGQIQYVGNGNI